MHQRKDWQRRGGCLLFFSSLYLVLILGFFQVRQVAAESVRFSAEAVLPANQISDKSYYDLKVSPNSQQILQLRLRNTSQATITVKVVGNNAITNKNGVLDYSKHHAQLLGGPSFETLLSAPQTVRLAPGEIKQVRFTLSIPRNGFHGVVLGGFYCYEVQSSHNDETKGFSIANKFAYTIGARLVCDTNTVKPKLALTKVTPGLENGYLTVFAQLKNPRPVLLNRLQMQASIYPRGQKAPIHQLQKQLSLAPRSQVNLPISWENMPLKRGHYTLKMKLRDKHGQTWFLKRHFNINSRDEKLNKKAVQIKEPDSNPFFKELLICFVVIICLLVLYIYQLKRR